MSAATWLFDGWAAALWRASWQGGLAVVAAWLICRWFPALPARFQCWLWRLVLVKFVVALLWSTPLELPLLPAAAREIASSSPTDMSPAIEMTETSLAVATSAAVPSFSPLWILFSIWILGVGFHAVRMWGDFRAARRLRHGGLLSVNQQLQAEVKRVCQTLGLRRPPALLEIDGNGSPLLIGILRPAVVLPVDTLSRLSAAERQVVLSHELAHARRGDLLWSLVAMLVRSVFCFHPLAWFSEQQLRLRQEIAADELAITAQQQDPLTYAELIVSILSKFNPRQPVPALSVGVAGALRTFEQRFLAMRYLQPRSRSQRVVFGSLLALLTVVDIVPWAVVAAQPAAVEPVAVKQATEQPPEKKTAITPPATTTVTPAAKPVEVKTQSGGGRGKFVSFENGGLTLQTNDGTLLRNMLPEGAKTFRWEDGGFKPVETVATLDQVKAGTWVHIIVDKGNATIRIGARKAQTVGSFVSFKDNRLLLLGKSLGESYVKKYGNQVHFNKFRADVEAYESVDGGEYKLVGLANQVLANVKEGTTITIHGEGDDNITLVQIGVPAKK